MADISATPLSGSKGHGGCPPSACQCDQPSFASRHRLREIGSAPLFCRCEESTLVQVQGKQSRTKRSDSATVSSTIHTSGS